MHIVFCCFLKSDKRRWINVDEIDIFAGWLQLPSTRHDCSDIYLQTDKSALSSHLACALHSWHFIFICHSFLYPWPHLFLDSQQAVIYMQTFMEREEENILFSIKK